MALLPAGVVFDVRTPSESGPVSLTRAIPAETEMR